MRLFTPSRQRDRQVARRLKLRAEGTRPVGGLRTGLQRAKRVWAARTAPQTGAQRVRLL